MLFLSPSAAAGTHVNTIHLYGTCSPGPVVTRYPNNFSHFVNGKLLLQYPSDLMRVAKLYVVYNILSICMLYGSNDGKVLAC